MTDTTNQNTPQQANSQPEGNGTAGKMFTQEEVNSIVKDRLARERAKGQTSTTDTTTEQRRSELDTEKAQLEADRQQFAAERDRFECERYCKENGLDPALVNLIGGSAPDEFRKKAESLRSVFAKASTNTSAAAVTFSTGGEHVEPRHGGNEPDGAQFFKPSAIY